MMRSKSDGTARKKTKLRRVSGDTAKWFFGFNCISTVQRTMHNSQHHVSFRNAVGNVAVTGVRAAVNDAVHVQVEMIEFGQQRIVRNNLIDLGVALRDPSVELSAVRSKTKEGAACAG